MNFKSIKNIIFDFGAVVINIDIPNAYRSFSKLSGIELDTVQNLFESQGAYADFESGKMNETEFRNLLRSELKMNCSDHEIDTAWNSMLLDVPKERIEMLRNLKNKYTILLLSNTNSIHVRRMHELFLEHHNIKDFTNLFHKAYLSFEINLLKPNTAIYDYVLTNAGINKEETIFLDDNTENVKSALGFGLPTIQVIPNKLTMLEILKDA